jgi:agmatinase
MVQETLNFGCLPQEYSAPEAASVAIVPVPYDGTSTWLKGADKGPQAIIEASANMELYDIETDSEVYRKGIFTDKPLEQKLSAEDMVGTVKERVRHHIQRGRFAVVIGGEHSVSIGSVMAHIDRYNDMTVLQLDAHCDLRDQYEGSKYNHACVMARIRELCPILQVGIRSMDSCEKESLDKTRVFFAEDIHNKTDWVNQVVAKLPQQVYITIDLDVFDPSIMPSTGTPEPGGLLWYEVLALLRAVCDQKNVVGFDVVELCPDRRNRAPDFMAAKLIYKLLSYKFKD